MKSMAGLTPMSWRTVPVVARRVHLPHQTQHPPFLLPKRVNDQVKRVNKIVVYPRPP